MHSDKYENLAKYALGLIAKKRYTVFQMREKCLKFCKKRRDTEELADQVVARLVELEYLDDEQFVKDYISERSKFRPRGEYLLRRELKTKGVERDLFDRVFGEMEFDEERLASGLLEQRTAKWEKYSEQQRRNKSYHFLASRGFHLDAIYKAIDSCYNRDVKSGSK